MFSPSTGEINQICSNGTFYQIALNTITEISNDTEESNLSTAPQAATHEQQTQEQLKSGSSPTAVVILAAISGLLTMVLVTVVFLVAVVLLWKRKQGKKTNISYVE